MCVILILAAAVWYGNFSGAQTELLGFLVLCAASVYLVDRFFGRRNSMSDEELNEDCKLYLATVEALANAIEAREQIAPGHIRRVQIYAVELGKTLRLPESELKALNIAALLHGVGKLAVPDYILNKPGSLTEQEKERVKLHSFVGAQIIESVAFPYPVAKAVKHYAESWDGFGYPNNLRGAEIPLTARILGLVDAYDTMRQDRTYRPASSREDARRMLLAGAGTKFEPKLVDTFLRNLGKFETVVIKNSLPLSGVYTNLNLKGERRRRHWPRYLEQIQQTNREVFALYELARLSSATHRVNELLPFLSDKIFELVPSDTCVIYLCNPTRQTALAVHTSGKNAAFLRGREIQFGEGIAGFALKNQKTLGSVNPKLDLINDFASIAADYTTMAALPLSTESRLIGAIAVYSERLPNYTEEHLRLLETVARIAADSLARTIQHEESETRALTDALTGLPNARSLQLQFEREVSRFKRTLQPFQFVMLDLDDFKKVNDTYGHKIGDDLLREIAVVLRAQLRDYDFLARYAGDEFVALLPELSEARARELCERIEQAVLNYALPIDKQNAARVGISIGTATYTKSGTTLDQIMVTADQNMYSVKAAHKQQSGDLPPLFAQADFFTESVN